jgi:folylpolyglutamate synthase/dihydropteroate synthase
MPVVELSDMANQLGLVGQNFEDVNQAITAASKNAKQNDLIIVMGSIFLVAEVDRSLFTSLHS